MKVDPFTMKRLLHFLETHRQRTARFPTLRELESAGFEKDVVQAAVQRGKVEELYVNLTNGAIVKGYKAKK